MKKGGPKKLWPEWLKGSTISGLSDLTSEGKEEQKEEEKIVEGGDSFAFCVTDEDKSESETTKKLDSDLDENVRSEEGSDIDSDDDLGPEITNEAKLPGLRYPEAPIEDREGLEAKINEILYKVPAGLKRVPWMDTLSLVSNRKMPQGIQASKDVRRETLM